MALKKVSEGKIIAGVCTGLSKEYKLDPWIFRLIFLFTGIGVIGYIIMAIMLPEEE